jgi:hypothetical protein
MRFIPTATCNSICLIALLAWPLTAAAQLEPRTNSALGKYGCQFHSDQFPNQISFDESDYQALLVKAVELESQLIQQDAGIGIWTEARASHLMELASTNRAMGNNEEARQQYEEALHTMRVNEGLYSLDTLPAILDLIAWAMTEDTQFMDRMGDRAAFLLEKNYGDDEKIPELVLWYGKLLSLREQAKQLGSGNPELDSGKAQDLATRIFDLIERLFDSDNLALRNRFRGDVHYFSGYDDFGNQLDQPGTEAAQISFTTGVVLESVQSLLQPPFDDSANDLNRAKKLLDDLYSRYAALPDMDKAALWDFYASYYIITQDEASAITSYKDMLEINALRPDYQLRALRAIGQLYEQQESWETAVEAYSCWSHLSRNQDPRVSLGLGNAYYRLENYEDSISNLNTYIYLLESREEFVSQEIYLLLKKMYYETDDFEAAEVVTRKIVQLFGGDSRNLSKPAIEGIASDRH